MRAIILAGGRGSRLAPWEAPKCLIPVNGLPIPYRLLGHLEEGAHYIGAVSICTGYRHHDVEQAVQSWRWRGLRPEWASAVECSFVDGDVSMLERNRSAASPNESLLICYGDELADVQLSDLFRQHSKDQAAMTFVAANARIIGGVVQQNGSWCRIVEGGHEKLVNIGFVIAEPHCRQYMPEKGGVSDWINAVAAAGERVSMFFHKGRRASVNTLADLRAAEEVWK